jgi:hypothetical protein
MFSDPVYEFKKIDSWLVWEPTYPNTRETLLLPLTVSPLLDDLYLNWKNSLTSSTPDEMLHHLLVYLRTVVFDTKLSQPLIIEELIQKAHSKEISIEYFVEKRAGLCRHFTLVAYYFLERLNHETLFPSFSTKIIRMPIEVNGIQGRHAWLSVFFEKTNRSFHFDPFWSILMDKDDPNMANTLRNKYGIAL